MFGAAVPATAAKTTAKAKIVKPSPAPVVAKPATGAPTGSASAGDVCPSWGKGGHIEGDLACVFDWDKGANDWRPLVGTLAASGRSPSTHRSRADRDSFEVRVRCGGRRRLDDRRLGPFGRLFENRLHAMGFCNFEVTIGPQEGPSDSGVSEAPERRSFSRPANERGT